MNRGLVLITALAITGIVRADVIDVRQGTNIAVAVDPSGQMLVVDLLGGLWRLPVSGGGAAMLMAPGSGIAQPRFAPDGDRVIVERNQDGQWDLWLLDLASGGWEQLTDTPFAERHPDFLADGGGIVFTSDRNGREQLWTLDLRSGALRQLSDEPGSSRFPTVSDSGSIAYVNVGADGSSLRRLDGGPVGSELTAGNSVIEAPSWRPGSMDRVLVFNRRDDRNSDLGLLIDADIPIDRRLTRGEDVFVGRPAWLSPDEFVYAADGQLWRRKIASTERRPVHMFAGVDIERPDTPGIRLPLELTEPRPAAGIRDLTVSRDGRSTVFTALGDLWIANGRSLRRLTDDPDVDAEPLFVGDSNDIAFVSDRSGSFDIWRLDTLTGERRQVTATQGDASSLVLSSDGARAYYIAADAASSPGDAGATTRNRVMRTALTPGAVSATIAGPFDGPIELGVENGRLLLTGAAVDPGAAIRLSDTATGLSPRATLEGPDPEEFKALHWSAPRPEPLVIQAGRVFDGIGNEYKRHVDIHISDGRIVAIVGRGRLPATGRVLDFSEATVLPGMIDVHVHHPANDPRLLGTDWLRHGVTTVREIADRPLAAVERAESWASGRRAGPRLVITPATPAEVPSIGALERTAGIVSSGFVHAHAGATSAGPDRPAATPSLPAAGIAIELSPLGTTYQDTLAVLGGSGGYMSTGLAASLARIGQGETRRLVADRLVSIVERAQRSFGRIAIGSDAPLVPYGRGFVDEVETLVGSGIPAAQVLRWATAGGAMALGVDPDLGTLEAGKLADLVIVDGDPLSRIGDLRGIRSVLLGGNVVWSDP